MPRTIHHPIPKRAGLLKGLTISILGAVVLATGGMPTLGVAVAADLAPTPSPVASASPAPSPTLTPGPTPTASAPLDPSPSTTATLDPTPAPDASSSLAAPVAPVPTPRAAPPGAVAPRRIKGQPYRLPAYVRIAKSKLTRVSFYGPGFYCISSRLTDCVPQHGRRAQINRTACGVLFTKRVVGVAHRSLPCGTLVAFTYRGRTVVAPVIDRGPYVAGRTWDLSGGLCTALRHCFSGPIRVAVVHRATGRVAPVRVHLSRR